MLVLFWLIYLVRLLYDLNAGVDGVETALLFFTLTGVVPAAAIAMAQWTWNERNIATALLVTGGVICFGALWLMNSLAGGETYIETTGRLSFEKLNPITLGHAGCTTALAGIVLWLQGARLIERLAIVAAASVAVVIMVYAASRGALVTFGLCLAVLLLCRRLWGYAAIGTAAILVAVSVFAVIDIGQLLEQTGLARAGNVNLDQSSFARKIVMEMALYEIRNNWEFGSSFTLPHGMAYPHNILVESWMATGIAGFMLLAIMAIRAGIAAVSAINGTRPMLGLILVQFLMAAQFSGALYAGWPGLWIALAVLLSAVRDARQWR